MQNRMFAFILAAVCTMLAAGFSLQAQDCNCTQVSLTNNGYCAEQVVIVTNQQHYGPFTLNVNSGVFVNLSNGECLKGFIINGCRMSTANCDASDECRPICHGDCPLDVVRFLCPTDNTCCHWEIR